MEPLDSLNRGSDRLRDRARAGSFGRFVLKRFLGDRLFEAAGALSPIGRTRTLPTGRLEQLDLVVACCAMYTMGRFHGYRAIAERPRLDAVLFVGDYVYEYGASNYPGMATLRPADPPHDTLTLSDYRRRYAQARTDLDLQAAHARAAWICKPGRCCAGCWRTSPMALNGCCW